MFRHILVPLDGSHFSEQALPIAKQLLEGSQAEVTLFRAEARPPKATLLRGRGLRRTVPLATLPGTPAPEVLPATAPVYAETKDQAVERREHELLEYLHQVARRLLETGRPVHAAVHFGEPASEITAYANERGVDLIVMATHGRSGLAGKLLGSVAAEVIRRSAVPVLVIPPQVAVGVADAINGASGPTDEREGTG